MVVKHFNIKRLTISIYKARCGKQLGALSRFAPAPDVQALMNIKIKF